jgi:hypothetical protein
VDRQRLERGPTVSRQSDKTVQDGFFVRNEREALNRSKSISIAGVLRTHDSEEKVAHRWHISDMVRQPNEDLVSVTFVYLVETKRDCFDKARVSSPITDAVDSELADSGVRLRERAHDRLIYHLLCHCWILAALLR